MDLSTPWAGALSLGLAFLLASGHGTTRAADNPTMATTQPSIRLWDGDAPGARGSDDADVPTLTPFLLPPAKAGGAAFIVCPGGAYGHLAPHEGAPVAQWLNTLGIHAFVLKYRLGPKYHHPAEMLDVQRAIRLLRCRAEQWHLDPNRIGIVGFSAGGHLASTVITHFQGGNPSAPDPVDRVSSRPNFAILAYPIVTLRAPWTHPESVHNLLGPNPDPTLVDELSNELHVGPDTPPTFLFHTGQDAAVPPENSVLFYAALRRAGVPAELHIYAEGPHGVGLANGHGKAPRVPGLLSWPLRAEEWLESQWLPQRRWSFSRLFRL